MASWRVRARNYGSSWDLHDEQEPFDRWANADGPQDLEPEAAATALNIDVVTLLAWAGDHDIREGVARNGVLE